jgi:hypothetical protein
VHAATSIESAPIENIPMIFNRQRVLPDKIIGQFSHGGSHSLRPPLQHRLAPAAQAFVRLNLEKEPPRRYQKSL